jgi:Ulp1 family protease
MEIINKEISSGEHLASLELKNLTVQNLECLREGKFLNDAVIMSYLK